MGRVMDPARMDHAAKGSAKRGPQIEGPILAEQKGNKLTLRTSGEGRGRGGRVGRSVDAAWPLFGRRHFASQSWPTLRRPSPTPAYLQPSAAHPILFLSPSPRPDAPASSLPPSSLSPALLRPFRFPFSQVCEPRRATSWLLWRPTPPLLHYSTPYSSSSSSLHPLPRTRLIKRGKLPNEISIRLETRSTTPPRDPIA